MSGTISQRAIGARQMPEAEQPIAERFRLAGESWVDLDAAATLLEEMKTTTLGKMKTDLIKASGPMPDNTAERIVKSGEEWAKYIERMCAARAEANRAKMQIEYLRVLERQIDRQEWLQRSERRMGRSVT